MVYCALVACIFFAPAPPFVLSEEPDVHPCEISWSGRLPYEDAEAMMARRCHRRLAGEVPDAVYLLEHPHVITMGKRGGWGHLKAERAALSARGVTLHETTRGGDITYHGPGQLIGYPILGLRDLGIGARVYVERLEAVLVETLAGFSIRAGRIPGRTGVWVGENKIAAIGVRISRGITSHGFALNVNTDLDYFSHIVPCGIQGAGVTSIERETGETHSFEAVIERFVEPFGRIMERRMVWAVAAAPVTT